MRLPRLTLTQLLNRSVEKYSEYYFVSYTDSDPYTFGQFAEKVAQLRAYLQERGVTKGTKVALVSENQPNWGICYFAITTLGAVVVPILPDFHPEEISSIIVHSESVGIFTSKRLFEKVSARIEDERWSVRVDDFQELNKEGEAIRPVPGMGAEHADTEPLSSGSSGESGKDTSVPQIPEEVSEEDWAVIIYTSGTTGNPKGVVLSHRNIVHNVISTTGIPRKLRPGDRLMSILPLAHTYECTIGFLTPLILGCRIFYLKKPPAPVVLLPALEQVRPQVILSVPLLIEKIYRNLIAPKLRKNNFIRLMLYIGTLRKIIYRFVGRKLKKTFGGELKYFIVGGAALAEDVESFLREARFPLAVGYGLTETSPLIAGSTEEYAKPYTIGPPLSGISVRIDSNDPENEPGEVLVKGSNVMQGYYKDPENTAEALGKDGWFHTGDLGVLDGDGYLSIKGRLKNMILGPSGENIYPEAIEAVLNEYRFVNDSVVFEQGGKLFARVQLDYDAFMEQMKGWAESARGFSKDVSRGVGDYLTNLRNSVNQRLNAFSRLHTIFEQKEPFEKTPTKKIKRYLYTDTNDDSGEAASPRHPREDAPQSQPQSQENKNESKEL